MKPDKSKYKSKSKSDFLEPKRVGLKLRTNSGVKANSMQPKLSIPFEANNNLDRDIHPKNDNRKGK